MHNSHVTVRQGSVVFSEFINQTLIITDVAEVMYRFVVTLVNYQNKKLLS